MEKYNHKKIESRWQKEWEKKGIYNAKDFSRKPKFYALIEFPYPSGEGLHVGHIRSNTAMDIIARKRRMQGFNVLYPIGWDAFGLPTENYAIKMGLHPKIVTKKNTDNFRRQLKSLGFSFDWTREINTTDPNYYKWTQWIFLKFFEQGLAYKKKMPINWCPSCKIGLANEEVVNGACERCGAEAEKKEKEQWILKITEYADKLLRDLNTVDYLDKIKIQQENWIGRSEGAVIKFSISNFQFSIEVFTTRPDTLFGCTYLTLSPEHELINNLKGKIENWSEVLKYVKETKKKSDLQRTNLSKEKTGVELKGVKAINSANNEEIPIWISDYVLASYGTGAIMAVPAHDERDFEFAKKFSLPIKMVICPNYPEPICPVLESAYIGSGHLVGSEKFTGMESEKAKTEIIFWLSQRGLAKKEVNFKLRDWIFSRQHYWGEPIPLIFCENCKKQAENFQFSISNFQKKSKIQNLKNEFNKGEILNPGWIAVSENALPVELPNVKKYQPTDTGESPLSSISKWVNVKCPKCGGKAKRETDTMPNWAGSSWYYLAYLMRGISNFQFPISKYKKIFNYWTPVDWYNGGMEHTTLHLLYSRFWNKFLYDLKLVPYSEPYKKRTSHGMVLGHGGEKMSKSRGNVINPDGLIKQFGADTVRLYEMFMGPFDQAIAWDNHGILGTNRFLGKVWNIGVSKKMLEKIKNEILEKSLHRLIKKVSEDIENMNFNTVVSSLMIFVNDCYALEKIPKNIWMTFLKLLSPFAPHITEELWHRLGNKSSIHMSDWPKYDGKKIQEETCLIVVQVNGKVRDIFQAERNISEEEVKELALNREKIKNYLSTTVPKKIIYIPCKIINIVI